MSAIAVVYTPKIGFVIGADGRGRWGDPDTLDDAKRQRESDSELKIFEGKVYDGNIAYGLMGTGYNEDGSFSMATECQKAAVVLSTSEVANYLEYVERFCQIIRERITTAHSENRFDYDPSKNCRPGKENVISQFVFCGYLHRRPFAYFAEITAEKELLGDFQPTQWDLRSIRPAVVGSGEISKLMYPQRGEPDSRFRKYVVKISDSSSQMEAVACVRGCLAGCGKRRELCNVTRQDASNAHARKRSAAGSRIQLHFS